MAVSVAEPTPPEESMSVPVSQPGRLLNNTGKQGFRQQLAAVTLRLHFYAGMFVGPFILIAALSGALYALTPTIEHYLYKDLTTVESVENPLPLSKQVAAAQAEHPDLPVAQIWPAEEATDSTRVLLSDPSNAEGNPLAVFVNPGSAEILGEQTTYSGNGELPFRRWVSGLHESLNLSDAGALYSELAASWLWLVALGGLYLWWRRVRNRRSTKDIIRPLPAQKRSRLAAMNIHAVTGVWLLIAILGLSATGITWSNIAGENVNKAVTSLDWKAKPIDTALPGHGDAGEKSEHAEHAGHGGHGGMAAEVPEIDASKQVEKVLSVARAEGLTGALTLRPPEDQHSAWQASERWVPWRLTSDAVTIDGSSGDVVDRLPFADLPLFSKLSSWGIYLHMGIMFGLPLQICLFLVGLGIAMIVVQGYRMWWKRKSFPGVPNRFPWVAWAAMAIIAVTIGYALPLLGVSMAVFLLLDIALVLRRRSTSKQRA